MPATDTESNYTKIGEEDVNAQGQATLTHNIANNAEAGDYEIRAIYKQNDTYKSSEDTATLEIRRPLDITVTRIAGSLGDTVTLQATIQSGGTNIPNKADNVVFKINNQPVNNGTPVSVVNGVATCSVTVNSPLVNKGSNTITAEYIKDSTYENKIGTGELYIADDLSITVQDVVSSKSTAFNVPLTVQSIETAKREDLEITVQIKNGNTVLESKVISNEQSADYALNDFVGGTHNVAFTGIANAGNYTIDVSTVKTDEFNAVHVTGTLTIKQDTLISLSPAIQSANQGDTKTLGAIITDENGGTVTLGQVRITYPDDTTQTVAIGSSNPNTFSYQVPANAVDGDELTYTIQYIAGNAPYEDSQTVTGKINIRSTTYIDIQDVTTTTGDTATITASVTDGDNQPVIEGEVEFEVEDYTGLY